jgi:hypothetical protein
MWTYDIDHDGTEGPRDEGCPSCSATADEIGNLTGLWVRGTTLAAVSRAPNDKITAFKRRMGWTFPWYSSTGSDFNYDFHVTVDDRVAPGLLAYRNETELAEQGRPWAAEMRGHWPGVSAFLCQGADGRSTGNGRRVGSPAEAPEPALLDSSSMTNTQRRNWAPATGLWTGGARGRERRLLDCGARAADDEGVRLII